MKHWVDGALCESAHARVSLFDRGFLLGEAVFDTTRGTRDDSGRVVPFARDRHIARLVSHAEAIGITVDPAVVLEAMEAVCAANPELGGGGRIRSMVTSGFGFPGTPAPPGGRLFIIAIAPEAERPDPGPAHATGASPDFDAAAAMVALTPWPRNQHAALSGIKSGSFGENLMCLRHAIAVGADEALIVNLGGGLVEGSTSNLFVVVDGEVVTPPLSSGCLPGVTRDLVIEWCGAEGIPIAERDLPLIAIPDVTEAFLTSAVRGVQTVAMIKDANGATLWSADARDRTRQIAALTARKAQSNWNP